MKSVKNQVEIAKNNDYYLIKVETDVDENNQRFYDGIALFNINTKQIDWKYIFIGNNEPKMSGNNICQLDNDKTLHIFKKTQNETA